MSAPTCRHTDPMTGVVAEVGTDGVPTGLALPEQLLDRTPAELSRAVLRALAGAGALARELLERLAEQDEDEDEEENEDVEVDAATDADTGFDARPASPHLLVGAAGARSPRPARERGTVRGVIG